MPTYHLQVTFLVPALLAQVASIQYVEQLYDTPAVTQWGHTTKALSTQGGPLFSPQKPMALFC